MSASSTTSNLKLPVFSDDDIPTWLGDWNNTVKTIDSIVAFKKVPATNGSNITGTITCIYNKSSEANGNTRFNYIDKRNL